MTYIRTAYIAPLDEWMVKPVELDGAPEPLVTRPDGSFVTFRLPRPTDYDEEGHFVPDVPPGARVFVA